MKRIILLLSLSMGLSCSKKIEPNIQKIDRSISQKELQAELLDTSLEFGPYGKGHGSIKRVFSFHKEGIVLRYMGHVYKGKKSVSIAADSTILDALILSLSENETKGSKKYHNLTKDGSYMTLRTGSGERTIINAFQRHSMARPDTIGIDKLRLIYAEGQRLLMKHRK